MPKIDKSESPYDISTRLYAEKRDQLGFDKDRLDDELIEHSGLYQEIGEQLALAESYRDEAESVLDIAKAGADSAYRKSKDSKEIKEAAAKAYIATDKSVVTAQQAFNDWKYLAKLWSTLSKSFEARNRAMLKVADLWLGSYWATSTGAKARSDAGSRIASDVRSRGNG